MLLTNGLTDNVGHLSILHIAALLDAARSVNTLTTATYAGVKPPARGMAKKIRVPKRMLANHDIHS
jgi:hypothetical protein